MSMLYLGKYKHEFIYIISRYKHHRYLRLLQSNKHIDELAAKILLERGLLYVNNRLEYSRDIR